MHKFGPISEQLKAEQTDIRTADDLLRSIDAHLLGIRRTLNFFAVILILSILIDFLRGLF
jgi:hypothetical protein